MWHWGDWKWLILVKFKCECKYLVGRRFGHFRLFIKRSEDVKLACDLELESRCKRPSSYSLTRGVVWATTTTTMTSEQPTVRKTLLLSYAAIIFTRCLKGAARPNILSRENLSIRWFLAFSRNILAYLRSAWNLPGCDIQHMFKKPTRDSQEICRVNLKE